jgi:hypothetical protein
VLLGLWLSTGSTRNEGVFFLSVLALLTRYAHIAVPVVSNQLRDFARGVCVAVRRHMIGF